MENSIIRIQFLGAAGVVTGSKYLISALGMNILVDCGLFQGLKELRLLNWEPLTFPPSEIDFVLITHGHLDHTGYLPRLVSEGFSGEIIGTIPTMEITEIILKDSAKIQEEDADRANKNKFSKHHPALALYNLKDVESTIPLFRTEPLNEWVYLTEKIKFRFKYNGHILGATFIELEIDQKRLVFSGDIGRIVDPLLFEPNKPEKADVLFIEATYGNRFHPSRPAMDALEEIINKSSERNGTILIPSFSVERTQLLMYLLWQLRKTGRLTDIPVFMDSPMGRNVLEVFHRNTDWHKLSMDECTEMCKDIKLIKSFEETCSLLENSSPKIIIAGSGMAVGGRVLTYFTKYLGDSNATILLAGFQAEGTRGRSLLDGAKEIKLYGKWFKVNATIENIEGLSGHADQNELIDWMNKLTYEPEKIFIVHSEKEGAEGLKERIQHDYHWNSILPQIGQVIEISNK